MKKRLGVIMIVLCLALTFILSAQGESSIIMPEPMTSAEPGAYEDGEELLKGYVAGLFGLRESTAAGRRLMVGAKALTGVNKVIYNRLVPFIQDVAAGRLTSTMFTTTLSLSDLGLNKAEWTASELGVSALVVNNTVTREASNAAYQLIGYDPGLICDTLRSNFPYEMYWYDKTNGFEYYSPGHVTYHDGEYYWTFENCEIKLNYRVAYEYAKKGVDENGQSIYYYYELDPTIVAPAIQAAQTARNIVASHVGESDYARLESYRQEICSRVTYNHYAADNDDVPYGNPWQLVWVFDNDPNTNVVCEGYSKAFQYLCDQTQFSGNVSCISVSGIMTTPNVSGRHMWNIVRLKTGLYHNYLVDVTNCQFSNNVIGLFMVGYKRRTSNSEYLYDTPGGEFIYTYDDDMFSTYDSDRLDISNTDYTPGTNGLPIDAAHFPDANFRAYLLDEEDWNNDGVLDDDELDSVTSITVRSANISSLKGIEYFTELTDLDCYDNALTELNLNNNTKLEYLDCMDNGIKSLDLSGNTLLIEVLCYDNQLQTLELGTNNFLDHLYCENNQLTSLNISGLAKLEVLDCSNNKLQSLNLSGNPALKELDCYKNQISTLNLSGNPALRSLSCYENLLTELDITNNPELTTNHVYCDEGVRLITPPEGLPINAKNFPNESFRAYVRQSCDADSNGYLTDGEIASVKIISVGSKGIGSLSGIGYFTGLKVLFCDNNDLTELDVSQNTLLTILSCTENDIGTLDLRANTDLLNVYCFNNGLLSLKLGQNSALQYLNCSNNFLSELEVRDCSALIDLACSGNLLKKLDVSLNPSLTGLDCGGNGLASLDVSNNTLLSVLDCRNNQLKTLTLPRSTALQALVFDSNGLKRIDISGCPQVLEDSRTQQSISLAPHVHLITGEEASFTVLRLPEQLTDIEEEAFSGTVAEAVEIPASCLNIAADAFTGCPNLREVRFPDDCAPAIDPDAFDGQVRFVTDSPAIQVWADSNGIDWVYE